MMQSSMVPLPPMHSMASAACAGVRLQIQYLPTCSADAHQHLLVFAGGAGVQRAGDTQRQARAASCSITSSASTFCINGCSARRLPKAWR